DGVEIALGHVREQQVLFMGNAQLVVGEALGEVGDRLHLLRGSITGNAADRLERDRDDGVPRLLVGVRVVLEPSLKAAVAEARRGALAALLEAWRRKIGIDAADLRCRKAKRSLANAAPLLLDLGGKALRAELMHQDLEPRLVLVVAPPVEIVDAQD